MRPALLAALVCLLLAPAAQAQIWQWTDEAGVIRYTPNPDRVPSDRRSTLVEVTLGGSPTPVAQTSEDEPTYLAPADEIGSDPFNAPEPARSVEVTDVPEPAWEVQGPPEAAPGDAAGSPEPPSGAPSDVDEPAAGGALTAETPPVSSPPPPPVTAAAAPPPLPEPATPVTPEPVAPQAPEPAAPVAAEPPAETATTAAAAPVTPVPPAPVAAEPPAETATTAAAAPVAPEPPTPVEAEPAAEIASATPGAAASTTAAGAASAPKPSARVDPWSSVAVAGAAAAPSAPEPKQAELTAEQEARRDELEELIAEDEAALKRLLSDTELDASGFEQSPELREIAARLPVLQAELRALEEGEPPEPEEEP